MSEGVGVTVTVIVTVNTKIGSSSSSSSSSSSRSTAQYHYTPNSRSTSSQTHVKRSTVSRDIDAFDVDTHSLSFLKLILIREFCRHRRRTCLASVFAQLRAAAAKLRQRVLVGLAAAARLHLRTKVRS